MVNIIITKIGEIVLELTNDFTAFCNKYDYIGRNEYNKKSCEYQFIISKGENNAGIFLTPVEYDELCTNTTRFNELLFELHIGFVNRFM